MTRHIEETIPPGDMSPLFSSLAVFIGWIPQTTLSQAGRILARAALGRCSRITESQYSRPVRCSTRAKHREAAEVAVGARAMVPLD